MSAMAFREPNEALWRGERPGHKGSQIVKNDVALNAIVVLHTVTADTTLFLCSYTIDFYTTAIANAYLYVRNASDVTVYTIHLRGSVANYSDWIHGEFWPPLEIPAGFDVCLRSDSASLATRGFIFGWEE